MIASHFGDDDDVDPRSRARLTLPTAAMYCLLTLLAVSVLGLGASADQCYMQIVPSGLRPVYQTKDLDTNTLDATTAFDRSTANALRGAVRIADWSMDLEQTINLLGPATNTGAGKVNAGDLVVSKYIDQYTPVLFKYISTGKALAVTIAQIRSPVTEGNGTVRPAMVLTMSYGLLGTQALATMANLKPTERLAFRYSELTMAYAPLGPSGNELAATSFGRDFYQNKVSTGTA
ncbi:hypothetical protein LTR56_013218 [Elasticomyces elasticus]|nr:hypothetical protein LTR56_013218 [Elasticomyces elasticus]KAK3650075.1 hypothetical protein LTR22_012670 [Elasticomyces elasticus]KAK4920090.1 hypothetical protein LTR49_012351 [Elasticomyces elasticus]KAK5757186.1 hypothetical protein LTS12_012702 [Elasticomyces elasticus]